jgi:hypothetical protein
MNSVKQRLKFKGEFKMKVLRNDKAKTKEFFNGYKVTSISCQNGQERKENLMKITLWKAKVFGWTKREVTMTLREILQTS